jgi:hypothetical protein
MEKCGEAWGYPAGDLSYVADRKDLARHEAEIVAHESFDYAIFDPAEAELVGCVYIYPARRPVAAAHRGGGVVVHAPLDRLNSAAGRSLTIQA